jgi:hypothetical protein
MPKLFGWCQTVFTELHSYLIPARGNAVPPRLILAGGTPFPWQKGGGGGEGVPPGKHHCHALVLVSENSRYREFRRLFLIIWYARDRVIKRAGGWESTCIT